MCVPCIIINNTCGFTTIAGKAFIAAGENFEKSIMSMWPRLSDVDVERIHKFCVEIRDKSVEIERYGEKMLNFSNEIAERTPSPPRDNA